MSDFPLASGSPDANTTDATAAVLTSNAAGECPTASTTTTDATGILAFGALQRSTGKYKHP